MNKIDWLEVKWELWSYWNNFTRPFRNFFHWIVKSAQYSWQLRPGQDFDWDYAFILKLLKYKLQRTRKRIVKNNIIADVDRVAHQIRVAEILIERIINNDYTSIQDAEHEAKWGEITFKSNDITRKLVKTKSEHELERQESMRIWKHQDYMAEQDWNYLWKHMKKYVRSWWD